MEKKTQLAPAVYWKLKALVLELEMGRQALRARSNAGLIEAGLDPNKTYSLNDTDMSVEEMQRSSSQPAQQPTTEDAKKVRPLDCLS